MPVPSGPVVADTGPYADVEALVKQWLTTTLAYTNVTHDLPTNLAFVLPLIVVERFGGSDDVITLDVARVDLDVFAASRDTAKQHALTIWSALRTRLPGHVHDNTTVVGKVKTISPPTKAAFDSRNTVHRFTMAVQIHLHQFAGVS
jgi:hypothetical protein